MPPKRCVVATTSSATFCTSARPVESASAVVRSTLRAWRGRPGPGDGERLRGARSRPAVEGGTRPVGTEPLTWRRSRCRCRSTSDDGHDQPRPPGRRAETRPASAAGAAAVARLVDQPVQPRGERGLHPRALRADVGDELGERRILAGQRAVELGELGDDGWGQDAWQASRSLVTARCRRIAAADSPTPITLAISALDSPAWNFRAISSRSRGSRPASAARTVARRSWSSSGSATASAGGSVSSAAVRERRRSSSSAALRAIPNSQARSEPRARSKLRRLRSARSNASAVTSSAAARSRSSEAT